MFKSEARAGSAVANSAERQRIPSNAELRRELINLFDERGADAAWVEFKANHRNIPPNYARALFFAEVLPLELASQVKNRGELGVREFQAKWQIKHADWRISVDEVVDQAVDELYRERYREGGRQMADGAIEALFPSGIKGNWGERRERLIKETRRGKTEAVLPEPPIEDNHEKQSDNLRDLGKAAILELGWDAGLQSVHDKFPDLLGKDSGALVDILIQSARLETAEVAEHTPFNSAKLSSLLKSYNFPAHIWDAILTDALLPKVRTHFLEISKEIEKPSDPDGLRTQIVNAYTTVKALSSPDWLLSDPAIRECCAEMADYMQAKKPEMKLDSRMRETFKLNG